MKQIRKILWIMSVVTLLLAMPNIEKYSGQFKLRMPKSLHKSLAEHSKKEGISMNQYCVYLLSKNDALCASK